MPRKKKSNEYLNKERKKERSKMSREQRKVEECCSKDQEDKEEKRSVYKKNWQKHYLANPENRCLHVVKSKDAQTKRLADPTKRAIHNKRSSTAQEKRLAHPTKRAIHGRRLSLAQKKRLADPTKRAIHGTRSSLAQEKRLADPTKRAIHGTRLSLAQKKRLADPTKRAIHCKRLTLAQKKRLAIPCKLNVHRQRLRMQQQKRLRNLDLKRKHLARVRLNEIARLKKFGCLNRKRLISRLRQRKIRRTEEYCQSRRELFSQNYVSRKAAKLKGESEKLIIKFFTSIKEGPNYVCNSCSRLWFKRSVALYTFDDFTKRNIPLDFVKQVCFETSEDGIHVGYLCSTCARSIFCHRIPKFNVATNEDLKFPDIHPHIQNLSPLESRFISTRIGFLQIREVPYGDCVQKGRVVNVPTSVNECINILPRVAHETETCPVQLRRQLRNSTYYLYEMVRPEYIINAANILKDSEVYRDDNVVVDVNRWLRDKDNCQVQYNESEPLSDDEYSSDSDENVDSSSSEESDDEIDGGATSQNSNKNSASPSSPTYNKQTGKSNDDHSEDIPVNCQEDVLNMPICETIMIDRTLVFAPGEKNRPLGIFVDKYAECKTFVTLFGGKLVDIPKGLTYQSWCKFRLESSDRRFAKNITSLFYMCSKLRILKIRDSIYMCLRKKKRPGVDENSFVASSLSNEQFLNRLVDIDSAFQIFAPDRCSPTFWKDKTRELMAMVRQLGPPTLFLTISCNVLHWPELLVILITLQNNTVTVTQEDVMHLSPEQKCELIRNDPVTVVKYCEHKFAQLFAMMKQKEFGIFDEHSIEDYAVRKEFQKKGYVHYHGMLYCKNGPRLIEGDQESEKQCVAYIDKFISCKKRSEYMSEEEIRFFQEHRHTFTCYKKNRRSRSKKMKNSCRFGIPFFPMRETKILYPLDLDKEHDKEKYESLIKLHNSIQDLLSKFAKEMPSHVPSFDQFLNLIGVSEDEYLECIRNKLLKPKPFLQRNVDEICINNYNPLILHLFRSNMDLQFITDSYSVVNYLGKYLFKNEEGMSMFLRECLQDIKKGNLPLKETLRKLGNLFCNKSEMCEQEAVFYILGLPLSMFSRDCTFINTIEPESRYQVVKPKEMLKNVPPGSRDVFVKNTLDHYVNRPRELEDICLADFVAWFNYSKKNPSCGKPQDPSLDDEDNLDDPRCMITNCQDGNDDSDNEFLGEHRSRSFQLLNDDGYVKKRVKSRIIRFRNYTKERDSFNYYREHLMLYLPWRNEKMDILKVDHELKYETHREEIETNKKNYFFKLNDPEYDNIEQISIEQVEQHSEASDDEYDKPARNTELALLNYRTGEGDIFVDAGIDDTRKTSKSTDFTDSISTPHLLPESEYMNLMRLLNDEQRQYMLHVLHACKGDRKLFEVVVGCAGVGKSVVINAIHQVVTRYLVNKRTGTYSSVASIKVLVCAPTGKAAFNISGMTLHSAFVLPLNQNPNEMGSLSDSVRNSLYSLYRDLELVIIDEVSMVGAKMFRMIDMRLRQIFKNDLPFGNRSILLFGDFNQLPPVADRYIFEKDTSDPYSKLFCNSLWSNFRIFKLTKIMRQQDDIAFAECLRHLAEDCMSENDIDMLKSRENVSESLLPATYIALFRSNKEVEQYNSTLLATKESVILEAIDTVSNANMSDRSKHRLLEYVKGLPPHKTYGLSFSLELVIGVKYMVTVNVDTKDGLCNGAVGTLQLIERNDATGCVERVWLLFENTAVGSKARMLWRNHMECRKINSTLTPIELRNQQIQLSNNNDLTKSIIRKQIPIVCAESLTIHKSQGGTYDNVLVKISKVMRKQEMYVALSRVKKLEGLFLNGNFFCPKSNSAVKKVHQEMSKMLSLCPVQFNLGFLQNRNPSTKSLIFHNIRSLNAHYEDIVKDECFLASTCIALVETWTTMSDQYDIPNFTNLFRADCKGRRKPYGVHIYIKNGEQSFIFYEFNNESNGTNLVGFVWEKYAICVCYKKPKLSFGSIQEQFISMVQKALVQSKHVIIVGDLNIDFHKDSNNLLFTIVHDYGMDYCLPVDKFSTDYGTNIDVAFSNDKNELNFTFFESYFSDHKPIICNFDPNKIIDSILPDECEVTSLVGYSRPSLSSDIRDNNGVTLQPQIPAYCVVPFENVPDPVMVSCYANSVCQLLLNTRFKWQVDDVNLTIHDEYFDIFVDPKLSFFKPTSHSTSGYYSSVPLRRKVGGIFANDDQQQSVDEMLMAICEKSVKINNNVISKIRYVKFCSSCNYYQSENIKDESILTIYFKRNVTKLERIDDLVLETYNNRIDHLPKELCPNCEERGEVRCRISIHTLARILIIQVISFEYVEGMLRMYSVQCGSKIFKQQLFHASPFELNCIVCHYHTSNTLNSGHYVTYLKDNINKTWALVNDENIKVYKRLPDKIYDPYLFVFNAQ